MTNLISLFPSPPFFFPCTAKCLTIISSGPVLRIAISYNFISFLEQLEMFSKPEKIPPSNFSFITGWPQKCHNTCDEQCALGQSVPLTKHYTWWIQPKITSQKITIISTEDRSGVFNPRMKSALSSGLLTVHPAKLAVPFILKLCPVPFPETAYHGLGNSRHS